jgi:hypothetical protein
MVGGNGDNGGVGAVWVYTRSGGAWSQQGSKLVGTGAVLSPQQGSSVALSADGNTAIVGGFNDNGGVGAAWIYTRSGGAWSQQGSKLVGVGGVGGSAFQGNSVAISADGNTAIMGAPHDNGSIGTAWVFVNPAIPTGPTISSGGVVNGANFLPGIAPGTWITIRGSNLSAATRIWTDSDFSGNNLPTQLDGVSVTANGKPAYVYYISPTQLNVLAPDDPAQGGSVPIQVTTPYGKSSIVNVTEWTAPQK